MDDACGTMNITCSLSPLTVPPESCPCKHQTGAHHKPLPARPSAPPQSHAHLQETGPLVRPPTCSTYDTHMQRQGLKQPYPNYGTLLAIQPYFSVQSSREQRAIGSLVFPIALLDMPSLALCPILNALLVLCTAHYSGASL